MGQLGAIDGKAAPGEGAGAQGRDIGPAQRILDPAAVPMEHFDIGEQMVGEQDGLRPLRVRVARHHSVEMLLSPGNQRRLEDSERLEQLSTGGPDIEPQVQGDLVIAAPARMQLSPQRAELLPQALLDRHVDVLGGGTPHPGPPP